MQDQDRPGLTPPPEGSSPDGLGATVQAPDVVSSPPRSRRIGTGVVIAAVGISALGIAGATYAAASDPSPSPSGTSSEGRPQVPGVGDGDKDGDHGGWGLGGPGPGGPGPGGAGQGGPGKGGPGRGDHGPRGGFGGAVHGTFVVPDKDGTGFQTVQMQHGTVTAVSPTSISVKSADGFTATYVIDADTRVNRDGAVADIKVDADVLVQGLVEGSTVTAKRVVDTAAFGKGRGPGPGDADSDGPGSQDSPTTAPSASA
jgi:hypothetical protein